MDTVLGINDEITTCDCCGRINLKSTVVISFDGGLTIGGHFGCVCASKIMKTSANSMVKMSATLTLEARIEKIAARWLSEGHTPSVTARGLWNKFGFPIDETETGIRFKSETGEWKEVAA